MTGLYAIADAGMLRSWDLGLREFAEGLRAGGFGTEAAAGVLQWRCKGGTAGEVLEGAAVLREVFAGSGCRLILNDWVELVEASGFDGVHVGQGDLSPEKARELIGPGKMLGVSTHNEVQVRTAAAGPADYVAVGPVFRTSTKMNAEPVVGLAGVRRARELTSKPLVAIGGISAGNAREVLRAGADAVAVIGALFQEGERVEDAARTLLEALSGV